MATIRMERIGSKESWVARITGTDEQHGFAREFLDGALDYSRANSVRSRGVYRVWQLDDGIYEIKEQRSWNRADRYFARVDGDTITKISVEDVMAEIA